MWHHLGHNETLHFYGYFPGGPGLAFFHIVSVKLVEKLVMHRCGGAVSIPSLMWRAE